MEFKTFLAGMDYPTGKITHAGTGMGKILYPRAYMGNPMGRFFLMGTGMESYYPTGMYPLPSLGMDEVAYAECRSPTFFIDHACMQCGWSHERSGWACSHVRMVYGNRPLSGFFLTVTHFDRISALHAHKCAASTSRHL